MITGYPWANQNFFKDIKVKIQENPKFKLINFVKLVSNDRNTATFTWQKPSEPVKTEKYIKSRDPI